MQRRRASFRIDLSMLIFASGFLFVFPHARSQAQTCIGDCNFDGEVDLGEVQRGFRIFLGTAPLETCENVDADADGEASLDEVQASFIQLLAGCQGEGMASPTPAIPPDTVIPEPTRSPTLTATITRTVAPTLKPTPGAVILGEVGAPGLPGGTASVSFGFSSQEGQASAIGFDVVFDATVLTLDTDDCRLSTRLTDQIRSVTFPIDQPAPPDRRLRLGVFPPIATTIPSFPDGELFVCNFGVGTDAVSQSVALVIKPLQVVRADSSVLCDVGECGAVDGSVSIGDSETVLPMIDR